MRDTPLPLSSFLCVNQAATATTLSSLLIENTAIWLINNPIVIPTETWIILSPNENEPRYADSAVVLEEYGERSPPSRPNADCEPCFASVGTEGEKHVDSGEECNSQRPKGREVGRSVTYVGPNWRKKRKR